MKLDAISFGVASGIIWGALIFISTFIALYTGYTKDFLVVMTNVYPGYTITPLGSLVGLIYGFIDLFIGGFLLAWIYNKIAKTEMPK